MNVDPGVFAALVAIFWPASQYMLASAVFVAYLTVVAGLTWAYELRRAR